MAETIDYIASSCFLLQ